MAAGSAARVSVCRILQSGRAPLVDSCARVLLAIQLSGGGITPAPRLSTWCASPHERPLTAGWTSGWAGPREAKLRGRTMAASAGSDTRDEQLEAAAWDLEQLVDGEGEQGARQRLAEALERSRAFAESYSGRLEQLDGDGPRRRHAGARRDPGAGGSRRLLRRAELLHRHGRPAARRAARPRPGAGDRDPDGAAVLRAAVGGARRRACRGAARRRGAGLLPPPPAQRAPLPRPPAERARGEDAGGEVAHRRERLDAPVRGADGGDPGAPARTPPDGEARGARRRPQPA